MNPTQQIHRKKICLTILLTICHSDLNFPKTNHKGSQNYKNQIAAKVTTAGDLSQNSVISSVL